MELVYTFQGLRDDGKWYVSAILPVNHPSLSADGTVAPTLVGSYTVSNLAWIGVYSFLVAEGSLFSYRRKHL
jgi:hypothetical protein